MHTAVREISNTDNIIDSRDIIARIEYLRDEIESAEIPPNEIGGPNDTMDEERTELASLEALADEASSSPDWEYGEALIADHYFVEYAQELASDCCEMPSEVKWPYTCIDWDKAADELKYDYSAVDFGDHRYWIRS